MTETGSEDFTSDADSEGTSEESSFMDFFQHISSDGESRNDPARPLLRSAMNKEEAFSAIVRFLYMYLQRQTNGKNLPVAQTTQERKQIQQNMKKTYQSLNNRLEAKNCKKHFCQHRKLRTSLPKICKFEKSRIILI